MKGHQRKTPLLFLYGVTLLLACISFSSQADIAMYKAKQSLNNKVQCYHHNLDNDSLSLISNNIVNTVVDAIHTGDGIQMHFQPIQSLKTKSVYYETLIRIKQEDTIIYPNDIFSVVDRRRLEVELDRQVVQQIV